MRIKASDVRNLISKYYYSSISTKLYVPLFRETLFLISICFFVTSCGSKQKNKSQAENPVKVSVATVGESDMNEQRSSWALFAMLMILLTFSW